MKTFKIKRVYEVPNENDGVRILVDRLWPRGLTKQKAKIDFWLKEIAPSETLRKWFAHKPERWFEFKKKYQDELSVKGDILNTIKEKGEEKNITLLYAAKDRLHNNAIALKECLKNKF